MSNLQFSEHEQQYQQLQARQNQEFYQLLETIPTEQQLSKLQRRHVLELKKLQYKQTELFENKLEIPSQKVQKTEKQRNKYSLRSCDTCYKLHSRCIREEGSDFCNRCIGKKCTFDRVIHKRGRKLGTKNKPKVKRLFFQNFFLVSNIDSFSLINRTFVMTNAIIIAANLWLMSMVYIKVFPVL